MSSSYNYFHCTKGARKPPTPPVNAKPLIIPLSERPTAIKRQRMRENAERGFQKTSAALGFNDSSSGGFTSTNRMTFLSPEPVQSGYGRNLTTHGLDRRAPPSIKTSWKASESEVQFGTDEGTLDTTISANYRGYEPSIYARQKRDTVESRFYGKRTNVQLGDNNRRQQAHTTKQNDQEWVYHDYGVANEQVKESKQIANVLKAVNMTSSIEIRDAHPPTPTMVTANQTYGGRSSRMDSESRPFHRISPFKRGEARDMRAILHNDQPDKPSYAPSVTNEDRSRAYLSARESNVQGPKKFHSDITFGLEQTNKYRTASNAHASHPGFVYG